MLYFCFYFSDLLDFLQQIEKNEYDENTADEKLLNLILLNTKDAVLLQCLFTSDGVSLLKMCSRLHFPLCQEYLLKNALYDPHELADQVMDIPKLLIPITH